MSLNLSAGAEPAHAAAWLEGFLNRNAVVLLHDAAGGLALSDGGRPAYDHALAAKPAAIGMPSFAFTPDAFPALMAVAIRRDDVAEWAANNGLVDSPSAR